MSSIVENLNSINGQLPTSVKLIAVSKFVGVDRMFEAYNNGQKRFGENYVQELVDKQKAMPEDIEWHFIGQLQRNKVKYIAPFVRLIHSVDSLKLLAEINKEAVKNERVIDCLLEIHIAQENTKSGWDFESLETNLKNDEFQKYNNVRILGVMGMCTFSDNLSLINEEFQNLKMIFDKIKFITETYHNFEMKELSMGMSNDWKDAIKAGSTMIRVGSSIFGNRLT